MNKQELRLIIREEIESLIKEHPDILEEDQRLDEGLMDWLKSIKGKIVDVFNGMGGAEGVANEIESDQQGWLTKIKKALMPTPVFKEMLAKVQNVVDQIGTDSMPPTTGLQLASKEVDGNVLQEANFEKAIAAKKQKPNFVSSIAAIMMIISFFVNKPIVVEDIWWVAICAGLITMDALSKILIGMARGKTNFNTAKAQMAQGAKLNSTELQKYIASKVSI